MRREIATVAESGVVDQQINTLRCPLLGGSEPTIGGQVCNDGVDVNPVYVLHLRSHGLQPYGVSGDKYQVVAVRSQAAGKRSPDPRRSPRHECHLHDRQATPQPQQGRKPLAASPAWKVAAPHSGHAGPAPPQIQTGTSGPRHHAGAKRPSRCYPPRRAEPTHPGPQPVRQGCYLTAALC